MSDNPVTNNAEVDVSGPLTLEEAKAVGDVPEDFELEKKPSILDKAKAILTGEDKGIHEGEGAEKGVLSSGDTTLDDETPVRKKSFLDFLTHKKSEPEVAPPTAITEGADKSSKKKSFLDGLLGKKGTPEAPEELAKADENAVREEAMAQVQQASEDVVAVAENEERKPSLINKIFDKMGTSSRDKSISPKDVALGGIVGGSAVVPGDAADEDSTHATKEAVEKAEESGEGYPAAVVAANEEKSKPKKVCKDRPLPADDATIVKEGTMQKQSRFLKKWRTRQVRLMSDGTLQYSKTDTFDGVKGVKFTAAMSIESNNNQSPIPHVLNVAQPKARPVILGFEQAEDRDGWATVLTEFKERLGATTLDGDGRAQVLKTGAIVNSDASAKEEDAAGTGQGTEIDSK